MHNKFLFSVLLIITLVVFSPWNCSIYRKPIDETATSASEPEPGVNKEVQTEEKKPPVEEKKEMAPSEPITREDPHPEDTIDPYEYLEEALDDYQDALNAWEKGDMDTALTALDEAYSLIIRLDLPPDSPLIQEKNDLRLLIAQRIQEIYASRRIAISNNHMTIPLIENQHVLKEIKSFQTGEKKFFEEGYKRSGFYREMILEELKKEGLPEQLSWVPMIESWFKVRAYSRARALGLWQFIASTGYRFGLKRDRWIDERMDPMKSTRAAIKYLSELHSFFGDWTTALASYNCGEFRVQRVIQAQRINYLDNFWDLYIMLPRETARFVPRFIATLLIINDPGKYGFNLSQLDPPLKYETVKINRPVQLSTLSKNLGLKADELELFNPELRYKSTPDIEYDLKVPFGYRERTVSAVSSLSRWIPPEATYVIHYVRRGETVSGIAQRYGTSISAISRLNNLRRSNLIRQGQRLKVPSRGAQSSASISSRQLTKEGERLVYVVKRGDSLYLIARAFSTTIQKIKDGNNLKSNLLQVGQKLVIQSGKPEDAILYTVKSGDIPYNIARKHGMSLNLFLSLNGLSTRSKIYPGQKLWIIPRE